MTNKELWAHSINVRPNLEILMVKTTMGLVPGLLFGLFLINSKVIHSWKVFL